MSQVLFSSFQFKFAHYYTWVMKNIAKHKKLLHIVCMVYFIRYLGMSDEFHLFLLSLKAIASGGAKHPRPPTNIQTYTANNMKYSEGEKTVTINSK